MKQEIIKRKWNKFLIEADEPDQKLRLYVAKFILAVDKKAIDANEVSNFIRKIPNVTVVSKDAVGREDETTIRALYRIKFVLERWEDLNTFIIKVLKKSLQQVPGVRVQSYRGAEPID